LPIAILIYLQWTHEIEIIADQLKSKKKLDTFYLIEIPISTVQLNNPDWVFQTGYFAPGSTRNDWGTSRPCLLPPMAVKSKPSRSQVGMVVDSE
jgi:hypothetical protein